ncbi:tRNA (adenosine(37)-N6)-threonylcarbamoyltransferase complex dimerization subunit type 1 TsaB [Stomatohabitans albus]|uniref:tRNA (adenosine(37)-N6)-threonylcarbamoyltransferase complex dimerization subunit type 1 TsaB n=1 Tax=Stomatohabitans albus TaxID=3110766 RepID=UPI00300CC3DE
MNEPIVLAIETATPGASVCLATPTGVVSSCGVGTGLPGQGRVHGSFLMPAIRWCLENAGSQGRPVEPSTISAIAVDLGPGLFTGLRVGITGAQVYAQTLDIPMVGAQSLTVLAARLGHVDEPVLVAIDGRRNQVFWGISYGFGQPVDIRLSHPDELIAVATEHPGIRCVGGGSLLVGEQLRAAGARLEPASWAHPEATQLADVVMADVLAGNTVPAGGLEPIYGRAPDAQITWSDRGKLQGGKADK